jgi:hypothetical protein
VAPASLSLGNGNIAHPPIGLDENHMWVMAAAIQVLVESSRRSTIPPGADTP